MLPLLEKTEGSRAVQLASIAHRRGKIHLEDLSFSRRYSSLDAYAQSKLACLMMGYELDRRLRAKGSKVLSVAAHPGVSTTNLVQYLPKIAQVLTPVVAQDPKQGALPQLYAALGDDIAGGDYTGPDGFREMWGKPAKVDSSRRSKDVAVAKALWEKLEGLTGISFP